MRSRAKGRAKAVENKGASRGVPFFRVPDSPEWGRFDTGLDGPAKVAGMYPQFGEYESSDERELGTLTVGGLTGIVYSTPASAFSDPENMAIEIIRASDTVVYIIIKEEMIERALSGVSPEDQDRVHVGLLVAAERRFIEWIESQESPDLRA